MARREQPAPWPATAHASNPRLSQPQALLSRPVLSRADSSSPALSLGSRSDIKLPRALPPPEVPGAAELSQKIVDYLGEEKDFYVIVQVACGREQIMDTKTMNN